MPIKKRPWKKFNKSSRNKIVSYSNYNYRNRSALSCLRWSAKSVKGRPFFNMVFWYYIYYYNLYNLSSYLNNIRLFNFYSLHFNKVQIYNFYNYLNFIKKIDANNVNVIWYFLNANISVWYPFFVKRFDMLDFIRKRFLYPFFNFYTTFFNATLSFNYTVDFYRFIKRWYMRSNRTEPNTFNLNNLMLYYNSILELLQDYNNSKDKFNQKTTNVFNSVINKFIYKFFWIYKTFINIKSILKRNAPYIKFSFLLKTKVKSWKYKLFCFKRKHVNIKSINNNNKSYFYFEKKQYNMLFYINNIVSKFFSFFYLYWINLYCKTSIINNNMACSFSFKTFYLSILNLYKSFFNKRTKLNNLIYLNYFNVDFLLYFKNKIIKIDENR